MTEVTESVSCRETVEDEGELPSPTLAESVERAVKGYMDAMGDQKIEDLYQLVLSEVEGSLLECVMQRTENNQSACALILGLNRGTLRKKLKRYGML